MVPSSTSPTGRPGGPPLLKSVTKSRSPSAAVHPLADRPARRAALVELGDEVARALGAHRLELRQVHLDEHVQHQPHVRLQPHDLAVIALYGAIGTSELEAEHAAADPLVSDSAIGAYVTRIRPLPLRLACHAGSGGRGVGDPGH